MRTATTYNQDPYSAANVFPAPADELPDFDQTFNVGFLKKFYSKSESWATETLFPSDPFSDVNVKKNNNFSEVVFPFSPETQTSLTSPSMNNFAKFERTKSFNIHLEDRFNSESTMMNEDVFRNLEDNYLETMQVHRSQSMNVTSNTQPQMNFTKPPEIRKISGANGMTMTFGGMTINKTMQNAPFAMRMASEPVRMNTSSSDAKFEALLRSKRIFKIEKDVRPKVSTKLNANLKTKKEQQSPLRVPLNSLNTSIKAPLMVPTKIASPTPQPEPVKQDANVLNFLQNMQKKGYSAQQIQNEIQRFIEVSKTGQQPQPLSSYL